MFEYRCSKSVTVSLTVNRTFLMKPSLLSEEDATLKALVPRYGMFAFIPWGLISSYA